MGCLQCDDKNREQQRRNNEIEKILERDKQRYKTTHRLLLLGQYLSPTCTLLLPNLKPSNVHMHAVYAMSTSTFNISDEFVIFFFKQLLKYKISVIGMFHVEQFM